MRRNPSSRHLDWVEGPLLTYRIPRWDLRARFDVFCP